VKNTPLELKQDQEHLRLKRVIVPIVATSRDLESFEPIGTGFIIYGVGKQAIVLTAAHNIRAIGRIERPYDRCHPTTLPEFRFRETRVDLRNTKMRIVYPAQDGNVHLPEVINAYVLEDSDMAVCTIVIGSDAPSDLIFDQHFDVDSSPPQKGATIMAMGYKNMTVLSHEMEGRTAQVKYSETLVRRPGTILDVFPIRGPRQHKMACFQCDTPFDNGMSGGPILQVTDGKTVAIGVIFSDMSFEVPHKGSGESALAAILWPAMGVKLNEERIGELDAPTLLDFQRHGLISDRGESLKHIRFSQDGKFISWVDTLA
jgi:Trypsin-like peptidase domain